MNKRNWLAAIAGILILTGSGCAPEPRTVFVRADLSPLLPARPVLPKVSAEELMCLPEPVYGKLYDRQRLLREYAERCEAVVRSTAKSPSPLAPLPGGEGKPGGGQSRSVP